MFSLFVLTTTLLVLGANAGSDAERAEQEQADDGGVARVNGDGATTHSGSSVFGRSFQVTATDVLHFGIGLSNSSETLTITTIPAAATIRVAFLYWTPTTASAISLDGESIAGVLIGTQNGVCYGELRSYRADVSMQVRAKRNAGYDIDAVDTPGAALFIVYDDPNVPTTKKVTIYDGIIQPIGAEQTSIVANLITGDLVDLDTLMIEIGDGESGYPDGPHTVASGVNSIPFGDMDTFKGVDGDDWDGIDVDISSLPASSTLSITLDVTDDCLVWPVAVLTSSVKSTGPPCVEATACSVDLATSSHDFVIQFDADHQACAIVTFSPDGSINIASWIADNGAAVDAAELNRHYAGAFALASVDGERTLSSLDRSAIIVLSAPGRQPCYVRLGFLASGGAKRQVIPAASFPGSTFVFPVVSSLVGDPHVTGPNGERFDFAGEAGRFYSLFSSKHFAVNVLLANEGPENRFMSKVGLLVANASLDLSSLNWRLKSKLLSSIDERLGAAGVNASWVDRQLLIDLCPGHRITVKQEVPSNRLALKHTPFFYDVQIEVPHCQDHFGGVVGQLYQCQYQAKTFDWQSSDESTFRIRSLLAPSGQFAAKHQIGCNDENDVVMTTDKPSMRRTMLKHQQRSELIVGSDV